MKIIFTILFCALVGANLIAQTSVDSEIGVAEITLARAIDADGNLSEARTVFAATDVPVHCSVRLVSTKSVQIKMNVVAVAASGLKPNSTIVSVNFKTSGTQDGVSFTASPGGKTWAAGKYRVDILLDGKAAKNLEFTVERSPDKIEKQKQSPSPKQKPKRKFGKNQ